MATKTPEQLAAEKYVNQFTEISKPGAGYELSKRDISKAMPIFREKYVAKPISEDKREPEFNKMASVLMSAIYGVGYDSPDIAGGQLKNMLSKAPEGTLAKVYTALERGDQIGLEGTLKEGVEASYQNTKLETTVADANNQSDAIKIGWSKGLASIVGDVNGYEGSHIKVLQNPVAVLQGLQNRLAIAQSVGHAKKKQ